MTKYRTAVVVPNWNGKHRLKACLDSLLAQTEPCEVVVVENGSTDNSAQFIKDNYPSITLLNNSRNLGFAGGVNTGIRYAQAEGYKQIALLNNDARADKDWLKALGEFFNRHPDAGIVTSKIYAADGTHLDSTGDQYTIWGLPYPRGRDEIDKGQYDTSTWVLGASGGASLYRSKMLNQVGLFDEDFFAYYEDIDLSLRAQLAGWKVGFEPNAKVYHQIGGTSGGIKGFTTYQTLKNLPLLLWKNMPSELFKKVWPRLTFAYLAIAVRALMRGQFGPLFKGMAMAIGLLPKKLFQRRGIQKNRNVSTAYLSSIITHDLPPNASRLRHMRKTWWRYRGRHAT